jgi:hypothetical protein
VIGSPVAAAAYGAYIADFKISFTSSNGSEPFEKLLIDLLDLIIC